jgi:hypothetical protein
MHSESATTVKCNNLHTYVTQVSSKDYPCASLKRISHSDVVCFAAKERPTNFLQQKHKLCQAPPSPSAHSLTRSPKSARSYRPTHILDLPHSEEYTGTAMGCRP